MPSGHPPRPALFPLYDRMACIADDAAHNLGAGYAIMKRLRVLPAHEFHALDLNTLHVVAGDRDRCKPTVCCRCQSHDEAINFRECHSEPL